MIYIAITIGAIGFGAGALYSMIPNMPPWWVCGPIGILVVFFGIMMVVE